MKKALLFTLLLLAVYTTKVSAQSCCTPANGDFQLLAMNADFKAAHLDPLPFTYADEKGSMMTFNTLDGKQGQAFYLPSDQATSKVLILFHEWWGLNDYIKQEAVRWQDMLGNVDVYAIDLYDGQVAADAETASKLSNGLDPKRGENIVKGLLSQVGNDKLIGTLGWCMGGSWAFKASVMADNRAAGCVMYYGFPEKDPQNIKGLQSDVLYIYGSKDKFITKDLVADFGKEVTATGKEFKLHTFDADHAFANPSNPKFDRLASKQAEQLAFSFLKAKMALQ